MQIISLLEESVKIIDLIWDSMRTHAYLKAVCHKCAAVFLSRKPVKSTGKEIDFSFVSLAAAKT